MVQRACSAAEDWGQGVVSSDPKVGERSIREILELLSQLIAKVPDTWPSHKIKPFPMMKAANDSILLSEQSSSHAQQSRTGKHGYGCWLQKWGFFKKPQKTLCIYFAGITDEKTFRKLFILGSILRFMLLAKVLCLLNIYDIIQYSIFTAILHNDNHL